MHTWVVLLLWEIVEDDECLLPHVALSTVYLLLDSGALGALCHGFLAYDGFASHTEAVIKPIKYPRPMSMQTPIIMIAVISFSFIPIVGELAPQNPSLLSYRASLLLF